MSSSFLRCLVVAVVLTLTFSALTATALTIDDFPEVDCSVAGLEHCSQCQYFDHGGVRYYLCAICVDTDTQQYSQATQGELAGTCQPYNPANCAVEGCHKCAADDSTKCVACEIGVPDRNTFNCLGESVSSATGGRYTSSKTPETTTTTTTTTTTPTTLPPTITTTTPTTLPPTTTTTTTTTTPCPVENCASCAADGATCSACNIGYSFNETGACMLSGSCGVQNCVQCLSASSKICSTCVTGYAPSSGSACVGMN